jgi:hypothetical protein
MPRVGGSADFKEALKSATYDGINAAAEWLSVAMQQLVDVQCGAMSSRAGFPWERAESNERRRSAFDAKHAPPNQPPYKETGYGQSTIKWVKRPYGAAVGVTGMEGIPGVESMVGRNYMAAWDSKRGVRGTRHPWLSLWKRYEKEMAKIMRRVIVARTGAGNYSYSGLIGK